MTPSSVGLSESDFRRVVVPLVVVLGAIVYANTLTADFVWDDASSVLLHEHVQDPSKFFQLFNEDQHAFGRGQGAFYRPLVSVSFMLDYTLSTWGLQPKPSAAALSPFIFHVTNTMWHIAVAVLLFYVLRRFGAPRAISLIVPCIYVVHPLHTEAVSYISGRADSMAAASILAALLFATARGTGSRAVTLLFSGVCFAVGLLLKESAAIYPVLLAATILCFPKKDDSSSTVSDAPAVGWIAMAPAAIVFAIYAVVKLTVLNFESDSIAPDTGLVQRVAEMLQSLTLYVALIFAPVNLHMERSLAGLSPLVALPGAIALAVAVGGGIWAFRNDRRRIAFALAWFTITWLPISGIFPLNAPMAEHWLYVPLAGFLWALAEVALPFIEKNSVARIGAAAAVAVWLLVLIGVSVERNRDWRDNESIFAATLQENPDSLRVRFNLAVTYEDILGNTIGASREFEDFLERYRALKEIDPRNGAFYDDTAREAGISLGRLYFEAGRYEDAARRFADAITLDDEEYDGDTAGLVAEASVGLGQVFLAVGQAGQAQEHFDRAIQLRPDFAEVVNQIRGHR